MNILFLTDEFYPSFGANSLIIKSLGIELAKKGNGVFVLPFNYQNDLPSSEAYCGLTIDRIIKLDDKTQLKRFIKKGKFLTALKIAFKGLKNKLIKSKSVWAFNRVSASYDIQRYIGENKIDVIISICCSIDLSLPVYSLRKKNKLPCKWIIYMLDPFATHSYYSSIYSQKRLLKTQRKILSACDGIACSKIIKDEFSLTESAEILNKAIVVEYPKIFDIRSISKPITLEKDKKHIFYAGTFNQIVRSANRLFEIIDRLRECNFIFHFAGVGWGNDNEFALKERKNCIFHGRMSWEQTISYECACDALINVGNVVKNQFPSKVLEYISTGKPIVDIAKYDNSLTKEYIEKYENGIILYEGNGLEENVTKFKEFVENNSKLVDYDTVLERFYDATPAFVAKQIEAFFKR